MKIRSSILAAAAIVVVATSAAAQTGTKYVRYQAGNTTSYGILEGDTIRELQGSIFENAKPTGRTRKLAEVKLLAPGVTQAMKPGDTFEVEVHGVGVLRNKIVAASQATRSGQ